MTCQVCGLSQWWKRELHREALKGSVGAPGAGPPPHKYPQQLKGSCSLHAQPPVVLVGGDSEQFR